MKFRDILALLSLRLEQPVHRIVFGSVDLWQNVRAKSVPL